MMCVVKLIASRGLFGLFSTSLPGVGEIVRALFPSQSRSRDESAGGEARAYFHAQIGT